MTNNSTSLTDLMDALNAKRFGISLDEAHRRRIERDAQELADFNAFQVSHEHVIDVSGYGIWDTEEGYDAWNSNYTEEFEEWLTNNVTYGGAAFVYKGAAYLGFHDLSDVTHFKMRWV